MERLVVHLWLTATVIVAIRFLMPVSPAVANRSSSGPQWCQILPSAKPADCRWLPEQLTMAVPSPEQADEAFYLVRPFAHGPCTQVPQEPSRNLASVVAGCGVDLVHEVGNLDLCQPGPDRGRVYRVAAAEIGPCAIVVGGPYGADGEPLEARAVAPMLTIYPALHITTELLDFIELRKRVGTPHDLFRPLEAIAFSGWLVLPLHGMDIPVASLPDAKHLLVRAAAAIGPHPVPNPVLLDLAGLSLCPTRAAMPRILAEMETVGLRPIGQTEPSPESGERLLQVLPLSQGGTTLAQVVSVRLSQAEGRCTTLQTATPAELADLLTVSLARTDRDGIATTLLLHRADETINDETIAAMLRELDNVPTTLLVTIFQDSAAGPLASGLNGPRILNMGAAVHEDSLFPAAIKPHGWLVQCYPTSAGSMSCALRLLAGFFGEALPVSGDACSACAFLPPSLDSIL